MNAIGENALVQAALHKVRQSRKTLHDNNGRHCALGVIHLDAHNGNKTEAFACFQKFYWEHLLTDSYGSMPCHFLRRAGISREEAEDIESMNDNDGLDFLTIARKCTAS